MMHGPVNIRFTAFICHESFKSWLNFLARQHFLSVCFQHIYTVIVEMWQHPWPFFIAWSVVSHSLVSTFISCNMPWTMEVIIMKGDTRRYPWNTVIVFFFVYWLERSQMQKEYYPYVYIWILMLWCSAWLSAGGEVTRAGGQAYWVWRIGKGWVFAWDFTLTRSTVLAEVERTRPNMSLSLP